MRQRESDRRPVILDGSSADEIAAFLAGVAIAAGPAVMDVYEKGGEVQAKDDGSPVTLADQRSEAFICAALGECLPFVSIVAEESISSGEQVAAAERFILVDPLDGTKEFISRNGEFTINVALINRGRPVAGAVYAPALARLWFGGERAFLCDVPVGGGLPASDFMAFDQGA